MKFKHQFKRKKQPNKDPIIVLADLRKRQTKLFAETILPKTISSIRKSVKERIAEGWELSMRKQIGIVNWISFEQSFAPKPGPMPDIFKSVHNGW